MGGQEVGDLLSGQGAHMDGLDSGTNRWQQGPGDIAGEDDGGVRGGFLQEFEEGVGGLGTAHLGDHRLGATDDEHLGTTHGRRFVRELPHGVHGGHVDPGGTLLLVDV